MTPVNERYKEGLDRILRQGQPLKDWGVTAHYGIRISPNRDNAVIDNEAIVKLLSKGLSTKLALITAPEIKEWYCVKPTHWLLMEREGEQLTPMVEAYLQGGRVSTSPSLCIKGGKEKIVFRKDKYYFDTPIQRVRFSLAPSEVYVTSPHWYLTGPNLHYILGVLNSRITPSILERQGVILSKAYKPKDMQKVLLPPNPTPQEVQDISTVVTYILYLEPYEDHEGKARDKRYWRATCSYFKVLLELLIACLYYPKEKGIMQESYYRNQYYDLDYVLTPNLKLPPLKDLEGCKLIALLAIHDNLYGKANKATINQAIAKMEGRIPM